MQGGPLLWRHQRLPVQQWFDGGHRRLGLQPQGNDLLRADGELVGRPAGQRLPMPTHQVRERALLVREVDRHPGLACLAETFDQPHFDLVALAAHDFHDDVVRSLDERLRTAA